MFALSWLFVLSSLFLPSALSAPAAVEVVPTVEARAVEKRVPAAPHFVLYGDKYYSGGPPDPSDIEGYNVFILSFLLVAGSTDQAQTWQELTADQRTATKSAYADAGISLMVAAYGSTNNPTSSGYDPVQQANWVGSWVTEYDMDGVDIDYEDFTAMNGGTAEAWLASFTQQIRTVLPQGQFILTHAPVAPWFSPNAQFSAGAYLLVDQTVGDLIDWYNIQFYNQGTDEYTTCDNLLNTAGGSWPGSALFEIATHNITGGLSKLVIGKPGLQTDETSGGYMDPATLATCVATAASQGWNAGVMAWQFPDVASSWIETVRGTTFPE